MWLLTIEDDEGSTVYHRLSGDRCTLGRAPDRDVVLAHFDVSRRHARLERRGGGWLFVDEGSENGSYINGYRTDAPAPFGSNDCVQLGDYRLTLSIDHDTSLDTPPPRYVLPARLRVLAGVSAGVELSFGANESLTIGGGDGCDLRLLHPKIRAVHALVRALGGGRHEIVDKSGLGFFVNRRWLSCKVLEGGDAIAIAGVSLLRYLEPSQAPDPRFDQTLGEALPSSAGVPPDDAIEVVVEGSVEMAVHAPSSWKLRAVPMMPEGPDPLLPASRVEEAGPLSVRVSLGEPAGFARLRRATMGRSGEASSGRIPAASKASSVRLPAATEVVMTPVAGGPSSTTLRAARRSLSSLPPEPRPPSSPPEPRSRSSLPPVEEGLPRESDAPTLDVHEAKWLRDAVAAWAAASEPTLSGFDVGDGEEWGRPAVVVGAPSASMQATARASAPSFGGETPSAPPPEPSSVANKAPSKGPRAAAGVRAPEGGVSEGAHVKAPASGAGEAIAAAALTSGAVAAAALTSGAVAQGAAVQGGAAQGAAGQGAAAQQGVAARGAAGGVVQGAPKGAEAQGAPEAASRGVAGGVAAQGATARAGAQGASSGAGARGVPAVRDEQAERAPSRRKHVWVVAAALLSLGVGVAIASWGARGRDEGGASVATVTAAAATTPAATTPAATTAQAPTAQAPAATAEAPAAAAEAPVDAEDAPAGAGAGARAGAQASSQARAGDDALRKASRAENADRRRARLAARARSGQASAAELRTLLSLCREVGDTPCVVDALARLGRLEGGP